MEIIFILTNFHRSRIVDNVNDFRMDRTSNVHSGAKFFIALSNFYLQRIPNGSMTEAFDEVAVEMKKKSIAKYWTAINNLSEVNSTLMLLSKLLFVWNDEIFQRMKTKYAYVINMLTKVFLCIFLSFIPHLLHLDVQTNILEIFSFFF